MKRESMPARFWAKVNKTDGCWEWTASKNKYGYGSFCIDGRTMRSHRVSYELTSGQIPAGTVIDHTCHNRGCVNPEHLRTVTQKQNLENLSALHSTNTSGMRGVAFDNETRKWLVTVGHNHKRHYGGRFSSLNEAKAAAIALRNKLYTHNDLDRKVA